MQLDGERAGVDAREQIALFHLLSLLEQYRSEWAVDLRSDRYGNQWHRVSQSIQEDRHVALAGARDYYRDWPSARCAIRRRCAGAAAGCLVPTRENNRASECEHERPTQNPADGLGLLDA